MLLHHGKDDREPEAGAGVLARALVGEERFEDAVQVRGRDAAAGVGDGQHDVGTWRDGLESRAGRRDVFS